VKQYDAIVIGGGPAGLTAAMYLGRFNRSVLVITSEDQRARLIPRTWNFPGHPEGIRGDELVTRCREHAEQYGAQIHCGEAAAVEGITGAFQVSLAEGSSFGGGYVIFATGVKDIPPTIPGVDRFMGQGLRLCPVCDGHESNGQRLAIFGRGDSVARHALYLTTFTDDITILFNEDGEWLDISPELRKELSQRGIRGVEGKVEEVLCEGPQIRGFRMCDGQEVEVDRAYSALPVRPRSEIAQLMGVAVDDAGFIKVDPFGRTSVVGVYAVGDVVHADYAQIVIGMGQGATAAIHINMQLTPG
jgi:thioredoxin reductase (NADPH)